MYITFRYTKKGGVRPQASWPECWRYPLTMYQPEAAQTPILREFGMCMCDTHIHKNLPLFISSTKSFPPA